MKNILVPIATREKGINNLTYAVNFASITQARVYVTCINSDGTAEEVLRDVLDSVPVMNSVQVVSKVLSGDIFEGIDQLTKSLHIDLIILSPKSVDISEKLYLGKVTGKIVKQSDIPLLIVPANFLFRKLDKVLMAFKNANYKTNDNFLMLEDFLNIFHSELHLLHVNTPDAPAEANQISKGLLDRSASLTKSDNATVFQGILEHYKEINPDMICLLRRKKQNMFEKIWQSNEILKEEFHSTKPLLILKERE
ncbi:MAG: universal stress protein [Nonlabens sp.]|uniref:universal stress protein n=1 Tax=Nonlabens sp. TaxID=1888209 RepID=UPI003EFA6640